MPMGLTTQNGATAPTRRFGNFTAARSGVRIASLCWEGGNPASALLTASALSPYKTPLFLGVGGSLFSWAGSHVEIHTEVRYITVVRVPLADFILYPSYTPKSTEKYLYTL